jgi:hypothetical protein
MSTETAPETPGDDAPIIDHAQDTQPVSVDGAEQKEEQTDAVAASTDEPTETTEETVLDLTDAAATETSETSEPLAAVTTEETVSEPEHTPESKPEAAEEEDKQEEAAAAGEKEAVTAPQLQQGEGKGEEKEDEDEEKKPMPPAEEKKKKTPVERKNKFKPRKYKQNTKLLASTQSLATQFVSQRHLTMRAALSHSARAYVPDVDSLDLTKIRLDPWRKEVKPFKRNMKAPNSAWLDQAAQPLGRRAVRKWDEEKPPPKDYHSRPVGCSELPPLKQHIQESVAVMSRPRVVTKRWNAADHIPKRFTPRTTSGEGLKNQQWFNTHSKPMRPTGKFKPDPPPDYSKGHRLKAKNPEYIARLSQVPKHWTNKT